MDEDALLDCALEAGADDIVHNDDGSVDVLMSSEDFTAVRDSLRAAEFTPTDAEVTMRPQSTVVLGLEDAQRIMKLLDMLEDLDDVQQVYSNADIPEEILARLVS